MSTIHTTMQGKVCLVTGANSGIGKATALGLARVGATVVMVCREESRGKAAQEEITKVSGNTSVDLMVADLSSQGAIRKLVADFKQRYTQLHVLINNAGVAMLRRTETVDGQEMTLAVNYLAPVLLTNLLLDTLKASAPARIINVSSDSQAAGKIELDNLQSKRHYRFMRAYSQSKLALVMFTYELARKLEGTGVTVNCLHPGFVATGIGQRGSGAIGAVITGLIFSLAGISPEEGAQTSLYLATSPDVANVTGKYFVKSVPKRSSATSYDEALQDVLWNETAKLVHLS
jgi:NAD(P)-dependent dehydrogenase (short-subunit alcohol dehydrogenase family)